MLLRQTLLYMPAQVLGPLAQFIAAIVWTHYLTPAEIGVFALIVAAQEFIPVAALFWFSSYTVRHYDAEADAGGRAAFLNTESAVLIGASVLAALSVIPLVYVINTHWTQELIGATLAYALSRGIVIHLSDRARAAHETAAYSMLQVLWPVLGLIAGLVLVERFGANAANLLFGYAIAQIVALVYGFAKLGIGTSPLKASRQSIRDALSFGLPLVFAILTIWVANNSIRFVVEHYQDATAVGLLTVGWGLGLRAATFAAMLTTAAAFPVAMKRARLEGIAAGQSQLERNGVLLLTALAPAAAGLWAIADPLVKLTISEPFHATTIAILPLAIMAGAIRSFRIHFGEQIFLLHEKTLIPLWNDIFDAVASTAGSLLGLWTYGLYGAVAGATAGAFASLVVTLTFARYAYRFGVALLDCIKIVAAAVVMGLAVRAMGVPATVLGIAGAISAGAILFTAFMVALYPAAVAKAVEVAQDLLHKPGTG